ncbi:tRNA endonuclease ANKZF1-like [Cylas formicarius]|uniref:tRNA endonuclease ANKZF1-like n=1 Tax=Cylas formicarius TaxID=197179 RepID=UPI00295840D4|nr:tRNA endonuclease ANKZF1-like [Cylas formicarius]
MTTMGIFSKQFLNIFDKSAKLVLLDEVAEEDDINQKSKQWRSIKSDNKLSCSYCLTQFESLKQQRMHYRLDWHRYNLKQSLQNKPPISEEEFIRKNDKDDISSISGSDSEEDDSLDTFATALGKLFLQNKDDRVFSLYRCLLCDKKEDLASVNFFERFREKCIGNKQWTILMLGGGHFAGAVFTENEPILHKTFHCYTVRSGQGGSQSSRDAKSGGSHPKSAGASLRRYNEQALVEHVKNIVTTWSKEIKASSLIIYRASGPYNKSVLFGGKEPLLDRGDVRLCTIPFSTGRATFAEVKRVHSVLSQAHVYDSINAATKLFSSQKTPENSSRRSKIKSGGINRAKSREIVERPLPGQYTRENSGEDVFNSVLSDDASDLEDDINVETTEISFRGLQEYDDSLTPEQRKTGQRKKKPAKTKNQKWREKENERKRKITDVLVRGNVIELKEMLNDRLKTFDSATISRTDVAAEFFNETLDEIGNSFLHVAAMNEHEEMLRYLLENEADPCLKNKNQQTAYTCTSSKLVRDVLKLYAKENPNKHNYNKAQIPINALTDEEIAEKRKEQRKVKREKEKLKKKEMFAKQKEEDEKNRFLNLSDREKRALAAERRILSSSGLVVARCFLCGTDMAGKVPFEYLENRFCSIECLKAHRLQSMM